MFLSSFIYLFIYISIYLSIYLSSYLCVSILSRDVLFDGGYNFVLDIGTIPPREFFLSIYLFICLSIYLSIYLSRDVLFDGGYNFVLDIGTIPLEFFGGLEEDENFWVSGFLFQVRKVFTFWLKIVLFLPPPLGILPLFLVTFPTKAKLFFPFF